MCLIKYVSIRQRQSETLGIHFINLLADELRQSETLDIHSAVSTIF
jgi:hypothetical protein